MNLLNRNCLLSPLTRTPLKISVLAGIVGLINAPQLGAALQCDNLATFNFTGQMQTYTVPNGVYHIAIEALGAQGADGLTKSGLNAPGSGGLGGQATGELQVTPGQTLNIFVGGKGNAFNGAGFGGHGGNSNGGTGGGASDVRVGGTDAINRVIVAGGGGGGGSAGCDTPTSGAGGAGGAGGGAAGTKGGDSPTPSSAPTGNAGGGSGGTSNAGGAAGSGCNGFLGTAGTVPDGGAGQTCCCFSVGMIPDGGGGGGGYIQGGGGGGGSAGTTGCSGNDKGAGGGGAGGTSYTGGVNNGSTTEGVNIGNGQVSICPKEVISCPSLPLSNCLNPGQAELSLVNNAVDSKDKLSWKWSKGPAVALADIGDPTVDEKYFFCVYDNSGLKLSSEIAAGGLCNKGKPCWKIAKNNVSFTDKVGTNSGIKSVKLKAADSGKSTASLSGSKENLPDYSLPLTAPLTAQLINKDSKCWTSEFSAPVVNQNATKGTLKAKYKR